MALAVIFIVLAAVIESSSMYFLAAASFLGGLVQRRFGMRISATFIFGTTLLGLIVAPQKLYCATFFGFCVYVAIAEYFRKKATPPLKSWLVKGIAYHIMLIVALIIINGLFGLEEVVKASLVGETFGKMPAVVVMIGVVTAEFAWIVFDRAYVFFQNKYGERFLSATKNHM